MTDNIEKQKNEFTPESGFNLVGIDYFDNPDGQLYLVEHFEMYQDALNAKKDRKNPQEFLILYKGTGGENLSR
ncbi:MAG: hypothetical protein GTN35_00575 [Nitrososphaeria archaeon]|nr:hypothetical protein [Nitrosopumilaceae archaeon]NIP10506.1 hypothetical protein [Nitrosopumilaceae archaeon]NIP90916.1 hypothetical protein [Nitrososphaeria archaeon]NIS94532.1 hypothetical protein [Nitrosopumilaceae archaeon]